MPDYLPDDDRNHSGKPKKSKRMTYPLIFMIALSILVTLHLIFIAIQLLISRKVHIKQFKLFDGDIPKHALALDTF